jgi:hypothetical protein
VDELVQDVVDGRLDAERALAALADICERPLERPWLLVLAAYALAGAALTPVLGGGWREVRRARSSGSSSGASRCPHVSSSPPWWSGSSGPRRLTVPTVAARLHRSGGTHARPRERRFQQRSAVPQQSDRERDQRAFDMFVTAMSIAYGLIVSASLFPGHAAPPSRGDDLRAS